mmetsp:Transcript_56743/g.93875  ORF Transcript_56743/g.93875 Transcript_56743/m.93875 type:complete len:339 (-) Transcript_56743:304-1320(-)|eukprot:CAMPEP_0119301842 /NCGR_PEP_ID=MMETSP1333-20130426/3555_1 /TAXON_ID=418940 /ORGANISM="Scyphosphaera apsteinii, Strain RCC1455" /LENGTH=338 /DNA_ID=CAMNT_0007304031 /DNA_START=38 /DNA_END=1054 /DNA_ORIENTATION=+
MAPLSLPLTLTAGPVNMKFIDWKVLFQRSYANPIEEGERFAAWSSNQRAVERAARRNPFASFGLYEYADWFEEELASLTGGPLNSTEAELQQPFDETAVQAALAIGPIDWVARGAVNVPISQGRCGTCAQFSATADIEAQWFLAGHGLVKLSEQEMIDCSSYTGPYGMGWVASIHKGLASNDTYPLANHSDPTLAGCRSKCNASEAVPSLSVAHIDGATCSGKPVYDNETQMLAWLTHGPLSVSIDATFHGYTGGVITDCNHTNVDHAVLLVGYGVDTTVHPWLPYWKLKNSWGPSFGEGGFFRMQAGVKCLGLRGACQAYIGHPPSGVGPAIERMLQ